MPYTVVVKFRAATGSRARIALVRSTGARIARAVPAAGPRIETLRLKRGASVPSTIRRLKRDPGVVWAVPDYYGRVHDFIPNDPGRAGDPGGWEKNQWNFLDPVGIKAPKAWEHMIAAGRPGGSGVLVAVIDTGIAYRSYRHIWRRAPDFAADQFVPGHNFVVGREYPDSLASLLPAWLGLDTFGHGTLTASLVAAHTNNGRLLTGLAYGAKLMPVRAANSEGVTSATVVAAAVRFAARHHAQVINMSLGFGAKVRHPNIPQLIEAIDFAHSKGVVIVASTGNSSGVRVEFPAQAEHVIGVGSTTSSGCLSDFSERGTGLDLVAPGGGPDEGLPDNPACHPLKVRKPVCEQSYSDEFLGFGFARRRAKKLRDFGNPFADFAIICEEGTSFSAPQVAAAAALVIASGLLGPSPSPDAVEQRLEATARDLGATGFDRYYGHGLLDAAAATDPAIPPSP